jgi:hypothetical protein
MLDASHAEEFDDRLLRIGIAPIVGFDGRALHLDSAVAELPQAGIVRRALLTSSQSPPIVLRATTDGGRLSAKLPASGSRRRLPAAGRETIGLIWRLHMKKALTAACAVTILVALSAQDASAATAAEQPVEAPGEATDEMREADGAVGELTDDTVITTKVKAALLQDPGTAALAIGVETFMGGVRLSGSVDSVDKKQKAQDIAERVEGVIAVDNALSVK